MLDIISAPTADPRRDKIFAHMEDIAIVAKTRVAIQQQEKACEKDEEASQKDKRARERLREEIAFLREEAPKPLVRLWPDCDSC